MRAVLQRVRHASVTVDGREVGRIGHGLLALVGVAAGDTEDDARLLAKKTAELRIFSDAAGRFNLSVQDIGGSVLVVSQFTLLADARKGRRPSFIEAAPPEIARPLVDRVAEMLSNSGVTVACGQFGAHMDVALLNDGPVTILLDTRVEKERS